MRTFNSESSMSNAMMAPDKKKPKAPKRYALSRVTRAYFSSGPILQGFLKEARFIPKSWSREEIALCMGFFHVLLASWYVATTVENMEPLYRHATDTYEEVVRSSGTLLFQVLV